MIGSIGILNVGEGDTKLSFDPKKPDEVKRSAAIITDMIRRGFVILIEVGKDEKGPIYRRVLEFDESEAEYIIAGDAPAPAMENTDEQSSSPPPRSRKAAKGKPRSPAKRRVKATGAKGVAVARTAGG